MDTFRDKFVEYLSESGPVTYIFMLAFYVTLCLPTEPIDFLPGFLFGWGIGSAVSISGKLLGLLISTLIGKYLLRFRIRGTLFSWFPILRKISKAIAQEGFLAIVLVRSLAVPAAVKNYGLSACLDVGVLENVAASAIILIPHSMVWSWLGTSVSTVFSSFREVDTSTLLLSIVPDFKIVLFVFLPLLLCAMYTVRGVARRISLLDDHDEDTSDKTHTKHE